MKIVILFTVLSLHFKISTSIEDYQFICAMMYAHLFILSLYILEAQGDLKASSVTFSHEPINSLAASFCFLFVGLALRFKTLLTVFLECGQE